MADYRSPVDEANQKALGFGATMDQANSLADFLQKGNQFRQQQQQPFNLAKQKSQLESEAEARQLEQAQGVVDNQAKAGRAINAKIGGVDISQKEDNPLKYMFRVTQKGNDATSKAYSMYASDLGKLKSGVDASKEGLDAVSDPNQMGSMGIIRSNMLRAMGMNRYNDQEASKSLPPALYQTVRTLFTGATSGWDGQNVKAGDDNNPLTPQQKAAATGFFRGHIANAQNQHDMIKNKARGSLRSSGYFSPDTAKTLEDGLSNSGFDQYTSGILAPKPGSVPVNYNSPPPGAGQPPPQPPQQPGFLDKLKSMLNPFGGQTQQQSPSAPMSFEEFKAKRQSGEIK